MSELGHTREWQWSVEVPGPKAAETGLPPRAFLWIAPPCAHVRGVVIGQHNLQEQTILEHSTFRRALGELGLAAIWITPAVDVTFDFQSGTGERFDAILASLAELSGYTELALCPVVPIGHSAGAAYPWNFARWAPHRTLAVISISGQWPYGETDSESIEPEPALAGIPGLVTLGEYEWADERAATGLKQRLAHPQLPLTMLAEAGAGHFDVSDEKVSYLALYVRKVVAHRLPERNKAPAGAVRLEPVDATTTGWLVDRWRKDDPPRVPASPVSEYPEPDEAFWCFDEELAVATEKFRADQRGKRTALLGFIQNGALVPQVASTHQQVTLRWPGVDGPTLKLGAAFLERVPAGRPERWTGLKEGTALLHPSNANQITIDRISGPVAKIASDTFALRFDRAGATNIKGTADVWLAAIHPGNLEFKRSVQQALLRLALRNENGLDQAITFAEIPTQHVGSKPFTLVASSSAGADVKVCFYVREGPAEIRGDQLTFTPLPRRARLPIKITVVAWQWGRTAAPRLKTAQPVERTFLLST